MKNIIVLIGKAGSGKSTAATHLLAQPKTTHVAIAAEVKAWVQRMNPVIVVSPKQKAIINSHAEKAEITAEEISELKKDVDINRDIAAVKLNTIIDHLGPTYAKLIPSVRGFYQKFSTEGGRGFDPYLWIDKAIAPFDELLEKYDTIVIDDARFDNEIHRLHNYAHHKSGVDFKLIHVVRQNNDFATGASTANHDSEKGISPLFSNNAIQCPNNGTLDELHARLDEILAQ